MCHEIGSYQPHDFYSLQQTKIMYNAISLPGWQCMVSAILSFNNYLSYCLTYTDEVEEENDEIDDEEKRGGMYVRTLFNQLLNISVTKIVTTLK